MFGGRHAGQPSGGFSRREDTLPAVDLVVRADVEKNDLIRCETKNQDDPIGVGQTDRVFVAVFSFEAMKAQLRCMRVGFKLKKNVLEQTG